NLLRTRVVSGNKYRPSLFKQKFRVSLILQMFEPDRIEGLYYSRTRQMVFKQFTRGGLSRIEPGDLSVSVGIIVISIDYDLSFPSACRQVDNCLQGDRHKYYVTKIPGLFDGSRSCVVTQLFNEAVEGLGPA